MNRALLISTLGVFLASGLSASATAQEKAAARRAHHAVRVDESSIPYDAQIVPTAMAGDSNSIEIGADHWAARGFTLQSLIAQIFSVDERLVNVPEGTVGSERYDLTVSLPTEVGEETMQKILVRTLEKKFRFQIAPESRTMDVYVLSAPNGPGADLHRHVLASRIGHDDGGHITYLGRSCSGVTSGGILVQDSSIADFEQTLQPDLDRVLLDETNLHGRYDFKISSYASQQDLFHELQSQLGLVVTPTQRTVTVLTARPMGSLQAAL